MMLIIQFSTGNHLDHLGTDQRESAKRKTENEEKEKTEMETK